MTIVIGFSKSKSKWMVLSTIIQLVEKRPFSHVYIRIPDALTGFPLVYQASHGMVNICKFVSFSQVNDIIEEYELDISDNMKLSIWNFMLNRLGVTYSFSQLFWIAVKKCCGYEKLKINGDDGFICSELIAEVCKQSGVQMSEELDYMTPSDLQKIISKCGRLI